MGHAGVIRIGEREELRAISHSDRKKATPWTPRRSPATLGSIRRSCDRSLIARLLNRKLWTLIRARHLIVRLPDSGGELRCAGWRNPCGYRLPASSTLCFAKALHGRAAARSGSALGPVLEQIRHHDGKDQAVRPVPSSDSRRRRVPGDAGAESKSMASANSPALTLWHPDTPGQQGTLRAKSRCGLLIFGLRPRRSQSGDHDPQLGITKAGNIYLRSLLVSSAPIMSSGRMEETRPYASVGPASRFARRQNSPVIVQHIVAVARKLAVLLHRIWVTARALHPVLCSSCLRIQIMLTVAQPRVPMTACRVGPSQGRSRKLAASTSADWTPTDTEPRTAHSKCRIETTAENNMRNNHNQQAAKTKRQQRYEEKNKNHLTP